MAAIDDTQAMIDYILLNYGKEVAVTADARADILKWLQAAELSIYSLAPWHWRQEETNDFTFAENTQEYEMDETYQDILFILNANQDPMTKVPWPIFQRHYRSLDVSTTAGMPTRWAWLPRGEPSPNVLKIAIWPVPSAPDEIATIITREKKAQTLVDANTNYSFVPYNYRMVVVFKALKLLAVHEGKSDLMQLVDKEVDTMLGALSAKEREFVQGLI